MMASPHQTHIFPGFPAYRHQMTILATASRIFVYRSPALISVAPRAVAASETASRLMSTKAKEVDPTMIHKYKHVYDEEWASTTPPTKEQLKHAEELASLSKKPKQPKVKKGGFHQV